MFTLSLTLFTIVNLYHGRIVKSRVCKHKSEEKMKKKYPIDLSRVGKRLKAVRDELGLSMDRLSAVTGYSKALISAAENGLKKPSVLYLYALFDKYKVSIHYIFDGEGAMFVEPEQERPAMGDASASPAMEDENIRQLLYLVEHVDMVRFAVLSHFIEYKTQHKNLIEQLLQEKQRTQPDSSS